MATDPDRLRWAAEMVAEVMGDGPGRDFMEESGRVVMRKMKERGLEGMDPSDLEPALAEQILRSSWIEAAITCFPGADEAKIISDLDRLFDQVAMDKLANADGSETAQ